MSKNKQCSDRNTIILCRNQNLSDKSNGFDELKKLLPHKILITCGYGQS